METKEGYICIPKELFTDCEYKILTAEAKLIYGILLERKRLHEMNEWNYDDGCIYVCCTIDEVMMLLGCGRMKAVSVLKELESVGLIKKKKIGQGRKTKIEVKNILMSSEKEKNKDQESQSRKGYICIPKKLFVDEKYITLSGEAKLLYGIMLDRKKLSKLNGWVDKNGNVYIFYGIERIMQVLHCSRAKAVKTLKELDSENGIGIIKKKRLGQGYQTKIYVNDLLANRNKEDKPEMIKETNILRYKEDDSKDKTQELQENLTRNLNSTEKSLQEVGKIDFSSMENSLQEVGKVDCNNNRYNNTYFNKTNLIISLDLKEKTIQEYEEIVKENIDYESLLIRHPFQKELIDEIINLIIEMLLIENPKIEIAKNIYPTALVKSRFRQIQNNHIEYVLNKLEETTGKVRNIKKYLMAMLFNSTVSCNSYFWTETKPSCYGCKEADYEGILVCC